RMGSTTVMLPAFNGPAESSPYTLVEGDDGYALQFEGKTLMYLDPVSRPKFYDLTTKDGIAYNKIAVRHSSDVLASTVIQSCIRWSPNDRCKFCAIG
ncbi:radical SAM protein, partial [Paenibacillus sepulcri]|nr:radical SAM protein [Paenibacillus sepulcri]